MNKFRGRPFPLICVLLVPMAAGASNLDTIGVTLLRTVTTNLNGTGVRVGQAEAYESGTNWEVNPGAPGVGQPTNLFTYYYSVSPYLSVTTTNMFPNLLGAESGHADAWPEIFTECPVAWPPMSCTWTITKQARFSITTSARAVPSPIVW